MPQISLHLLYNVWTEKKLEEVGDNHILSIFGVEGGEETWKLVLKPI